MDISYRSFIKLSLIVGSVLAVVWYMPEVIMFIGIIFRYLIPFIIGLSIAFVLNVLMKIIEKVFKYLQIMVKYYVRHSFECI